jgi:hypothetical protein
MARKPRLFFSHSTEDGSSDRAILMGLADALKDDYDILLDRTSLVPGSNWRPIIDGWIIGCDAALILITPGSIARQYCQYEWAILSLRRKTQERFLILPIYLGSTPNDIKDRPDQISEISGYFNFDTIDSLGRKLKERLSAEPFLKQRTRMQILLIDQYLRETIRQQQVIENAAENINLDLGAWDPTADKWLKFAIRLMAAGLTQAFPALQDLKRFFGRANADEFGYIVDLIGFCSWVDANSAHRIRACAVRDATGRTLFGLNVERAETANCYVLTGSDKHPKENWPIGTALDVFASYDDLHDRIQSALIEALQVGDEADTAALKEELDSRRELKQPVFVLLRASGLSADWLGRLCNTDLFASVNFLVLTGEAGVKPELLPDDAVLKPVLPAGFERKLWSDYAKTKRLLGIA